MPDLQLEPLDLTSNCNVVLCDVTNVADQLIFVVTRYDAGDYCELYGGYLAQVSLPKNKGQFSLN